MTSGWPHSSATGRRVTISGRGAQASGRAPELASRLGAGAWRAVLDEHYQAARSALGRHGGREIDTAGDGLFASFDGPARAIRCAIELEKADRALGLRTRAGVHTGEVERAGAALRGINVVVAARIGGL